MSNLFAWAEYNKTLIQQSFADELILAFDPSYLLKSGKKTAHGGQFWSGKDRAVKKGIEVGTIAVVDVRTTQCSPLRRFKRPGTIIKRPAKRWLIIIPT